MATNDDKGDAPAKSGIRRQFEAEMAKMLNDKSWKDHKHPSHLAQVTRVYNLYRKLHGTK